MAETFYTLSGTGVGVIHRPPLTDGHYGVYELKVTPVADVLSAKLKFTDASGSVLYTNNMISGTGDRWLLNYTTNLTDEGAAGYYYEISSDISGKLTMMRYGGLAPAATESIQAGDDPIGTPASADIYWMISGTGIQVLHHPPATSNTKSKFRIYFDTTVEGLDIGGGTRPPKVIFTTGADHWASDVKVPMIEVEPNVWELETAMSIIDSGEGRTGYYILIPSAAHSIFGMISHGANYENDFVEISPGDPDIGFFGTPVVSDSLVVALGGVDWVTMTPMGDVVGSWYVTVNAAITKAVADAATAATITFNFDTSPHYWLNFWLYDEELDEDIVLRALEVPAGVPVAEFTTSAQLRSDVLISFLLDRVFYSTVPDYASVSLVPEIIQRTSGLITGDY